MSCNYVSPPPAPRLPVEVSERIIDWVAALPPAEWYHTLYNDTQALETLRACALTCRAWTPRAQLHMFRALRIKCTPNVPGDINDFRSLLARVPALATSVSTVVAISAAYRPSTLHTIPLLLPQLVPRLSYLRLAYGLFYPPPGVFPSMRRFISVTRLMLWEVTFHSVHDLRRTVNAFRALQTLEISYISWHESLSPTNTLYQALSYPASAVRLRDVLIIAGNTWLRDPRSVQFVLWLAKSGALSSLTALRLDSAMILDAGMLAAVEMAIYAAAGAVEEMLLTVGPETVCSKRTWY